MDIKYLYENTQLTIQQIAAQTGNSNWKTWKFIKDTYSSQYRKQHKSVCYRNSKLGNLNPMLGNTGSKHHNFVGSVSDNKGYLMRLKPLWYTGRKNSKHVFEHSIIVCENLGLSEVPKGWVVHHCDFNPLNNSFGNLVMLLMGDHSRLHRYLEGVTTISKESTLKWVETYGTPWKRDDIVCSAQECAAVNNLTDMA